MLLKTFHSTIPWHHFMPASAIPKSTFPDEGFSEFLQKVSFPLLNYPYLYLRKHSSVVLCATLHSVYEQSSLTNTFTARNFSFFFSPFFLLSLCSEFQIKTELNWSPFAILESYLSRSWLWQSFSAFLPSSQHSVWTQNNRETKIHVREQRKPSIKWSERRKMFPISQRDEKFFQFSLFFSSLGSADAVALITENGTQSFPFACREKLFQEHYQPGRGFVFHS